MGWWWAVALAVGSTGCSLLVAAELDSAGGADDGGPPEGGVECLPPGENRCGDGLPVCDAGDPRLGEQMEVAAYLGFEDVVPFERQRFDLPMATSRIGSPVVAGAGGVGPQFLVPLVTPDSGWGVYRFEAMPSEVGYRVRTPAALPMPTTACTEGRPCDVMGVAARRPWGSGGRFFAIGRGVAGGTGALFLWRDPDSVPRVLRVADEDLRFVGISEKLLAFASLRGPDDPSVEKSPVRVRGNSLLRAIEDPRGWPGEDWREVTGMAVDGCAVVRTGVADGPARGAAFTVIPGGDALGCPDSGGGVQIPAPGETFWFNGLDVVSLAADGRSYLWGVRATDGRTQRLALQRVFCDDRSCRGSGPVGVDPPDLLALLPRSMSLTRVGERGVLMATTEASGVVRVYAVGASSDPADMVEAGPSFAIAPPDGAPSPDGEIAVWVSRPSGETGSVDVVLLHTMRSGEGTRPRVDLAGVRLCARP